MEITAQMVKSLRDKTNAGMSDCKKALVEADGNEEKAIEVLRKRGQATAAKRLDKVAAEGAVGSYIHMGGKIGVLIEVNCETDFVARTEGFQHFVKDVAMHICASEPQYVSKAEVPADVLASCVYASGWCCWVQHVAATRPPTRPTQTKGRVSRSTPRTSLIRRSIRTCSTH